MTEAEQRLWSRMRRKQIHGVQFYRQKPLGRWIVDLYSPGVGLVVEIDGGQHFTDAGVESDRRRDAGLRSMGLCVLRYDNVQVLEHTDAVVEDIARYVLSALGPG